MDVEPDELDGTILISDITTRDNAGNVLDASVTTSVPTDTVREGIAIERLRITEANTGNTRLRADVFTDDMADTPTLNIAVTDNDSGADLVSLTQAEPSHSEFQFA